MRTDTATRLVHASPEAVYRMRAKGVRFVREPKLAPYGKVAVFEDLCGHLWDLVRFV